MQENKFLTHILTDIKVKLEAEFLRKISLVKPFLMKNGKTPNLPTREAP